MQGSTESVGSQCQACCASVRKPSKEPAILPEKQSHLTNLAEDAKRAQEHESAALFQITKSLSKFVLKQVPGVRMHPFCMVPEVAPQFCDMLLASIPDL